MSEFVLSAKQIQSNWNTFREIINEISPSRKNSMNRMYDELEERIVTAPASSFDYFHNAIPGGYIDHVLRVYNNTIKHYDLWKGSGMIVDNFTVEELSFAALKHDLGKLGMPGEGREFYITNKESWSRGKGKVYATNPKLAYMESTDRTFFMLQHYGIQYSENEMYGIQLTDGMYNDTNKPYLVSYDLDKKLKNTMGLILHHADLMAARFEFERWATSTGKFDFNTSTVKAKPQVDVKTQPSGSNSNLLSTFSKLFPDAI